MGIFGWIAVLLLVVYGLGFFLKLGAVVLNIILVLAIASFIVSFFFRRKTPTK